MFQCGSLTRQRLCESVFDDVFKTKGVSDKVNLNMGYIAQYVQLNSPRQGFIATAHRSEPTRPPRSG